MQGTMACSKEEREKGPGVGRRHTFRLHIYFSNAQFDLFKFHNVYHWRILRTAGELKLFASLATWHISCAVSQNMNCMKPSR